MTSPACCSHPGGSRPANVSGGRARHGLRGRGAAAVVAAAFFVVMLGTTLPTPLYPLYRSELGLGGTTVTVVFATYAVGVAAGLILFGGLSDHIGRRAALLPGLGLAVLSDVAFLVPNSLTALFVGRVLSGLSAGVFTGTATAMLVDLAPAGRQGRYGLLAAAVTVLGLGLGPVVAGALAQFGPAPLTVPYLAHLVLVAVAAGGLRSVAEPMQPVGTPARWRLQSLGVPEDVRGIFVRAGIAGVAGFAVLGLFAGVSPAFLDQVLEITAPVVVGLVVCTLFACSAIGQVVASWSTGHRALLVGTATLTVGAALIGVAVVMASLAVLLTGAAVAGLGQGMSFRAGLGAVTTAAPVEKRGEVASSFFLLLYAAIAIPVVGVGTAAGAFGLVPACVGFAAVVTCTAGCAFVSLRCHRGP